MSRPALLPRRFPLALLAALSLAAGSLAAGCFRAAAPTGEALRARDFYPLAVGHRWDFEATVAGRAERKVVEIVGEEGGFHRDTGGGRLKMDALGLRDPDRYLLREPLVAGTRWTNVISAQSIERYEITSAGTSCAVPAGTFPRCVRVRGENPIDARRTLVSEWTYAEGIGLVELRTILLPRDGTPIPQVEARLVSFQLAP